ncbi:MAG: aspartate kinase [Deltaproteobacteria bacterium]|nr:aspartate kinase [Deltaproteobacteria bacterium]
MSLIVQKFGGTSLAGLDRIRHAARRIVETRKAGHEVVVVVSAMAGETDRLVGLAHDISPDPDPREYDVLVSTGETQTSALMVMAVQALGVPSRSFTGAQVRVRTDTAHTRARIQAIDVAPIRDELARGAIVVVAGFQGTDQEGNITTLGRGGSDTSAVAVAAALKADWCEIYTDVEGVFTSDPNMVPAARKLERVSYDEMLEMASLGVKVLQVRAVKFAKQYGIPLHVRSSFSDEEGTWVVTEEDVMERLVVSGVTYNRGEAKVTIFGIPDTPGVAARIFSEISDSGVVVDVIVQNVSTRGHTDLTFTVPREDLSRVLPLMQRLADEFGAAGITSDDSIAKISVVGLGMRDHAGVASKMFRVLSEEGINIEMINTSEIKISVVIEEKYTELACRALHEVFELGAGTGISEES